MPRNFIAIVKGSERFWFFFDDTAESRHKLRELVGVMAADPQTNFNWLDAARVSQKIYAV
jgi:hypothetical protein